MEKTNRQENIEYKKILDLETKLIEKIKKNINIKQNIDIKDIKIDPIRKANEFNSLRDYEPVFKCSYTNKNGQNISYYIKPNNNEKNINTVFPMVQMGAMGYNIPEFSYYPEIKINSTVEIKDLKNDYEYDFNTLVTEDTENFIEKDYLKNQEEIIEISENETINRILMALKYSISDNKTINVKKLNKNNNKIKTIYFDPNLNFNSPVIEDLLRPVKLILSEYLEKNPQEKENNNRKNIEKIPLKILIDNFNGTFEANIIKIFVEFLKIEKGIESVTIKEIKNAFKTVKKEDFYNFLINKNKEFYKKELSKNIYYYKKNTKFFKKI